MSRPVPEAFYRQPWIQALKDLPRWTYSTSDKVPLSIPFFKDQGQVFGARGLPSLTTLEDSLDLIDFPLHHTFYLDVKDVPYVVLDVEPSCPEDLKNEFLKLPYLYGERSMSGKGVHLVFPFPEHLGEAYPLVFDRTALKAKTSDYEILLCHFVTLTGDLLDPPSKPQGDLTPFWDVFEELAQDLKEVKYQELDIKALETTDIPYLSEIMTRLEPIKLVKSFQDYGEDHSRYEMALSTKIRYALDKILKSYKMRYETYTLEDRILLNTLALMKKLEPRPKHQEMRSGLPWLMYVASRAESRLDEEILEDEEET